MTRSFPSPLQLGVLDQFVHPHPASVFCRPVWHEGDVLTASGYIACRFVPSLRRLWGESDFLPAPAGFFERYDALPWARFHGIPDEWRPMDDVRGHLFRRALINPWTTKHLCAPSPVWWVNGGFLARLSHLQLIARLPRCEVHLGVMGPDAPLIFRFNGGMGMLARDPKLTTASFTIFEPHRHEDGSRIGKQSRKPTADQERKAQEFHAQQAAIEAQEFTYPD
ncbi:hypothetical protein JIN84_12870 [Luteolibacter yonseiensis]|uniref:Uncharacterized protein n=1 Tax=Luteolibacter yonseiensis TaxID=1144680 RepID=A0A934R5B6_9BACT|nr:hypothetical protein [Luteolibacter yonseiensis]MBK1816511.1 hypothetical protein [Luteolibacter yonseiensis]